VLRAIVGVLPRQPRVTSCVLDFEKAAWLALTTVLPTVTVPGCNFHWAQAMWRKVQEYGLQVTLHRLLLKCILEHLFTLHLNTFDDADFCISVVHCACRNVAHAVYVKWILTAFISRLGTHAFVSLQMSE